MRVSQIFNIFMNYFLLKTDPDTYSVDDFEKDNITLWDGVHNFQAINFIKQMQIGDKAYIYHSQTTKSILALGEVIEMPFDNYNDPRKSWAVKIKFIKKFSKTVSLADLKSESIFDHFLLLRNPRLSVMPVPEDVVDYLNKRLS